MAKLDSRFEQEPRVLLYSSFGSILGNNQSFLVLSVSEQKEVRLNFVDKASQASTQR